MSSILKNRIYQTAKNYVAQMKTNFKKVAKKIWKEHMEELMNVENEWSDSIGTSKVEGAVRIEVEEI